MIPFGWPARRRRGDVVVLLYHRVGPAASEIELPADAFRRHLEHLTTHERILTIEEAVADDPEGGVVVTFDDGYGDFYHTVLPILVSYHVPAVLYLATALVNGNGAAAPGSLTWSQLRETTETGLITVGSHTHDHRNLSRATEEEAEAEMKRSKELIEDRLGAECRHFAYPWSVASADAERAARRLFRSAALDGWKTNRAGRVDPYRLGRVPILRSDGQFFFRRKVRGELDTEAWLYRALGRGPWGKT